MARLPMRAKLSRSSHRYRTESMIELFFPILEDFCPFFIQIAQEGLILPRWGLILPRIPSPTPVTSQPFRGYVRSQNTPNLDPNGAKCMFQKWTKLFYKWAKKKNSQGSQAATRPAPQESRRARAACSRRWRRA